MKVVDDHTLRVTLVQPDVTFLYALTQPFTAPVPREVVKRYGRNFSTHVVGNGPYALQSYDSQGQRMVFKRFPGYFWRGLPYVDEVEYRWGIDPGVLLLMMQRGEVDMLPNGFATTELQRINASSALKPYLFQQGLLASRWVNLQPRVPAFRNPRLRQALNWATDREQLQRVTGGEGIAWGAPFPKDMLGGQRTFTPYTYDPARAKRLLRESGIDPRSVQATLWVTDAPEPQLGQVLQQQWKALGIGVTLKQATYDTVNELALKGRCDAWISTYYAIYPTAIDVISQYWETGGSANYTKYSNALVDRLTRRARTTSDPARRNALLARAEAAIGGDGAGVFLENVNWLMGRNPKRIHNFHYSGVYGPYYDRLWLQA